MAIFKRAALFLFLVPLLTAVNCKKSSKNNDPVGPVELQETIVADDLNYPWEILWGPDNQIWFTQRGGEVSRLDPATGDVTPVYDIPDVVSNGEGGLLGMVLHPSFTTTPHVFVVYDYNSGGGNYREKVVRFTYSGGTLTSPFTVIDNLAASGIHNGSRLLISGDKIFITTGDASDQSLPQNINSRNGKILRLNLDGSIPADNPVANNPYWSLGHRNPQGLVFANNNLISSEHGPDSDDEINLIEKGRNYGWPDVKGFCDAGEQSTCTAKNVKEPLKAWTPTVATSGLDYYNSDLIPQWKNSLLLTTLKGQTLYQMELNSAQNGITSSNTYLNGKYGRLRDICISPEGKVYVCTSNGDDRIIELKPK
ncbi:MAG: PQQ-dependent sugar dehydrogenase [Pedobacter sp.]|nr:MAG: PQQ-dependent sugar dehydrogenase [Pedobacter sp.]